MQDKKLKIIHCVESYFPAVGGMQEVVKQLSEKMVGMGHEVTVLTRFHPDRTTQTINGVIVESFRINGNPKEAKDVEEIRYVEYLLNCEGDVIAFFAAQQWATDLALPVLGKLDCIKIAVPTGYSGLYDPSYKEYFSKMRTYIHDYDCNVYLSDDYRDINFARENKVKEEKIRIIPNGASEAEFESEQKTDLKKKLNIPSDHFLVLHVGSYTGEKGHLEALQLFFKSKLKNSTFLLIGNKYDNFLKRSRYKHPILLIQWFIASLQGKKVIFTFLSREDTVAAFKTADLFLFPSNIECSPIVLFEAMASHTAFLATDVGNSIEIVKWSGGGLILPTFKNDKQRSFAKIKEGADMLNKLYFDQKLREGLAEQGYRAWKENFTWEKISQKYVELYHDFISRK